MIGALEDAEDYKAFKAAVIADYDAQSAVERELVLRLAILSFSDISDRKRSEAQLQYLADHDPVTGLFNRRRFMQELAHQVAYSARYGTGGAVMVSTSTTSSTSTTRLGTWPATS